MGKFFNGKVKKKKETLIKYAILGGGILIILIIIILIIKTNNKNNTGTAIIETYEEVSVEINSALPDKIYYFSNLENYNIDKIKIDTSAVDITKIGVYLVKINANEKNMEVKLNVIDTTKPTLTVKDLSIDSGQTYNIEDFIDSCEDNSKTACSYEYYDLDIDNNGNVIDYSNYTEDGTYQIKIIALDESDNESEVKTAKLTIGKTNEDNTKKDQTTEKTKVNCQYGDLTIPNSVNYPIAVYVGDTINGCALNRDLWDNETTQSAVTSLFNEDYKKLQTQWNNIKDKQYPNGAKIVIKPYYIAVWNEANTGLIGYGIYVKMYVADASVSGAIDTDNYLKLSYYIKADKTRQYEKNELGF